MLGNPQDPFYNQFLDENRRNKDKSKYVPYLSILSAVMGAEKGSCFIEKTLDKYKYSDFILQDGNFNTEVMITMHLANVADIYGYRYVDEQQTLVDGSVIYSASTFSSKFGQITKDTIAVHCALGGWQRKVNRIDHYRNLLKLIYIDWQFGSSKS